MKCEVSGKATNLPSCVPYRELKREGLIRYRIHLHLEIHTYDLEVEGGSETAHGTYSRVHASLIELVVHKSEQNGGLSHARITNHQKLAYTTFLSELIRSCNAKAWFNCGLKLKRNNLENGAGSCFETTLATGSVARGCLRIISNWI